MIIAERLSVLKEVKEFRAAAYTFNENELCQCISYISEEGDSNDDLFEKRRRVHSLKQNRIPSNTLSRFRREQGGNIAHTSLW